ncbi:hypothetical protein FB451DRAFT_1233015 [Mycena latifolia]|nr:hypothetical protein FB451DRAFT_1233015 [Mycena latifolia]
MPTSSTVPPAPMHKICFALALALSSLLLLVGASPAPTPTAPAPAATTTCIRSTHLCTSSAQCCSGVCFSTLKECE